MIKHAGTADRQGPNIVIDMALSHSVGPAVEKVYRRTDLSTSVAN
jgi:hypothetical protein